MRTNDLNEAKKLDVKALLIKVKTLNGEIADLLIDKNMSKLKDLKAISKKKKEVAQFLTIVRQKELLESLESRVESREKKEPEVEKEVGTEDGPKKRGVKKS